MLGRFTYLTFVTAAIWLFNGVPVVAAQNVTTTNTTSDCHCGFHDPTTDRLYTDSLIVYFNETQEVPLNAFTIDTFAHDYEKGFHITYREGAVEQNVYHEQGSVWNLEPGWLALNVSGYDTEHLVNGAQLQTVRQDIQYGTFRVFMRSPAPYASGGSALVMKVENTLKPEVSANLDLMNMDDSGDMARMVSKIGDVENLREHTVNYTTLQDPPYDIGPWNFWEWRMDWSAETVDWYAGVYKMWSQPTPETNLFNASTAFYLKHYSNGDPSWMQGPPTNNSGAAIGWVRLFFNSTVSSQRQSLVGCSPNDICSTEDTTLRLSTPFEGRSTVPIDSQAKERRPWVVNYVAVEVMGASVAFSVALIVHLLFRKAIAVVADPTRDVAAKRKENNEMELTQMSPGDSSTTLAPSSSSAAASHPTFLNSRTRAESQRPLLTQNSTQASSVTLPLATPGTASTRIGTPTLEQKGPFPGVDSIDAWSSGAVNHRPSAKLDEAAPNPDLASSSQKGVAATVTELKAEGAVAATNPGAKPPVITPQRMRVDYLAGLVALCSLLVSATHFVLTFAPSAIMEYLPSHYSSEIWARKTVEPFFLNEIWVGLFFTTSTRFLTTGYLRNGSLKGLAEKIVCRTPRLMIPITAVILLVYFLMDCGALRWLEYIPSITWTTWVGTSVFPNFGWFINATLEMIYLIPNAAPQITWYYAAGVLWTIPVQLQNSWLVLLGVVIVREIKRPWKRFGYYAFCIINHWYARSWGSYFWFGLLLADLDITFKYRKTLYAKPWTRHYPLLTLAIVLVLLSLGNDLVSIHTGWTFSTQEKGIHPDYETGLPVRETAQAGYPAYIEPKLNGLVFCVCAQYIVELSTVAQKFLSSKPFLLMFPHVFTIYLIHCFVFWSVGAMACAYFAAQGLAYWLNILLTAIISYTVLFASLPIVTPVMEMLGKEITKGIWISASEEPPKREPALSPEMRDELLVALYGTRDGGVR